MAIKYNIQGLFIYATMGLYLFAFFVKLARHNKIARKLFFLGFIASLLSVIYRAVNVSHIPMQNLFEVFLCLGMLIYPIYLFAREFWKTDKEAFDMILGFIFLFPSGFIFSDAGEHLPPALQSPLFGPHVAVYMLGYIFMAKAAYYSACNIYKYSKLNSLDELSADFKRERTIIYNMIQAGFPLLTAGLLLGSIWGKLAWGHYWNWDPKELWSLASWLVYVGYFHYRYIYPDKRGFLAENLFVLIGFAFIVITLIWVNLSSAFSGLHSYAF